MEQSIEEYLKGQGFNNPGQIYYNIVPAILYEESIRRGEGIIAHEGPLVVRTGKFTGRTPKDRFIVKEPSSEDKIWWGEINQPFEEGKFYQIFHRMTSYFQGRDIFVRDCYVGADYQYSMKLRIITERAWQNLFSYNMFLNHPAEDLSTKSDVYTPKKDPLLIISAPGFLADPKIDGSRSEAFILIHLGKKMVLIGGTGYGGEIKKSVFTVMNYFMPQERVFPMHCSANVGSDGQSAIFFGLSGTGKTTLSSDPSRFLIGDDEHGWSESGLFNFEGGCYAKVVKLSEEAEPLIYRSARRFGTVLENVVYSERTRILDFDDVSITENTRAAYPLEYIEKSVPEKKSAHPSNIIMLTCDAFGVLPPVALLTPDQAVYYFLSGYTAKIAGTEAGIVEPIATFSTCFGAPFMILSPIRYAEQLKNRIQRHKPDCWLINTGWIKGPYGVGIRIPIQLTRQIVKSVLNGDLKRGSFYKEPYFDLLVPVRCPGVPQEFLTPSKTWQREEDYQEAAAKLKTLFKDNFEQFEPYLDKAIAGVIR